MTEVHQPFPMTVVMATLGGATLKDTIECLNRGLIIPAEILVCIPEREASCMEHLPFPNVRVIVTQCRGQVAQRAIGFQNASHDIVMQLDDDIRIDNECLKYLIQTLVKYGPHVAVAPALLDTASSKIPQINNTLWKIVCSLLNGRNSYKMGTVGRSGMEISFDPALIKEEVYDAEWLPGGCVLHFRDNLVKENFFPYPGKAYCEDLLHSYHLMKKGVTLKVDLRAHCSFELVPLVNFGFKNFLHALAGEYKARKYFVKLSSRSYLRMHLFYLTRIFNYVGKKIIIKAH